MRLAISSGLGSRPSSWTRECERRTSLLMSAIVHRDTDGARLICKSSRDGLTYPPGCVGGNFVAASFVELVHSPQEANVAFLDKIEKRQAAVEVLPGDGSDQAQVSADELPLCGCDRLNAVAGAPEGFFEVIQALAAILLRLLQHLQEKGEVHSGSTGLIKEGMQGTWSPTFTVFKDFEARLRLIQGPQDGDMDFKLAPEVPCLADVFFYSPDDALNDGLFHLDVQKMPDQPVLQGEHAPVQRDGFSVAARCNCAELSHKLATVPVDAPYFMEKHENAHVLVLVRARVVPLDGSDHVLELDAAML